MSRVYQFGIVGAGGISEVHLQAIAKEPRAEVRAIADVILELAKDQAKKHQIPQVYSDYREMLAEEELDAIIICVPNFLHASLAMEALQAGKHVITEKPMALNAELAKQMKGTAEENGKVLMVGQNNRFHAATFLLKEQIAENKLGNIYHAKTGWVRRNGIPGWGSWFTQKELAGGGPLIDIGVHVLDLTLWLMGYPRPVSVFAKTYDIFGPQKQKLSMWGRVNDQGTYNVEDSAVAMIQFESGFSLVLDASWASHIEKERVYVELYGEKAGASVDIQQQTITLYSDGEHGPEDTVLRPASFDGRLFMLTNFIDAIEGKKELICKPDEGIIVQQILDAIYESSRTGELVRFH